MKIGSAILGAILLFTAGGHAAQENQTTPGESVYMLAPRDLVTISVYNEPDLQVRQRIDGNGAVRVALIGNMTLSGRSIRDAEKLLEETYVDEEYLRAPHVTIIVEEYAEREVSVLGQVASPGKVTFPVEAGELDIVDVISRAGGFTGVAKSDAVQVTRNKSENDERTVTVNVERMVRGGSSSDTSNFVIRPGDVIFVPERVF